MKDASLVKRAFQVSSGMFASLILRYNSVGGVFLRLLRFGPQAVEEKYVQKLMAPEICYFLFQFVLSMAATVLL